MKKMIICILVAAATAGSAAAQEKLTLAKSIRLALEQNPNVTAARNDAQIARNTAAAGNAELLPRLSVSSGANYQDSETLGASTTTSAGVSLSYTLFDGFGTVYRMKRAKSAGRLGLLAARNDIEQTVVAVSVAYYRAASSWEALQIAREALNISRERLKRAEERSAYGRAGAVDVLSARVDVNTDSVTVVESQLLWEEAGRSLNLLLNRNIDHKFSIDTDVEFQVLDPLPALINTAKEYNAVFAISREQTDQAGYTASSAAADLWPDITLTGSAGYSRIDPDFSVAFDSMSRTVRGGLSISWTLFSGGRLRRAKQSARLELNNQKLRETYAEKTLETQIVNAFEAYSNSRLILDLENENLEAAKLNFQRTRDFYRLGQVTSTQFREAQLNLIRSRTRLQTTKFDAKLDELTLMQLAGILIPPAEMDL